MNRNTAGKADGWEMVPLRPDEKEVGLENFSVPECPDVPDDMGASSDITSPADGWERGPRGQPRPSLGGDLGYKLAVRRNLQQRIDHALMELLGPLDNGGRRHPPSDQIFPVCQATPVNVGQKKYDSTRAGVVRYPVCILSDVVPSEIPVL